MSAQKKEIIDDEAPNGIVIVTIDKAGDEIIRIMNESQLPYIHDAWNTAQIRRTGWICCC